MEYYATFLSPLGEIFITATEEALTGLYFENSRYFDANSLNLMKKEETTVLKQTELWLSQYFGGEIPAFTPPVHLEATDFRLKVWEALKAIPYGKTVTYGDIAAAVAAEKGAAKMSSRAVGSAVGRNPISIIIPCHRVIGANGSLTGYSGGLERKEALLDMEKEVLGNLKSD